MHVVHIYKDYPPVIGGIENHLKLLAEGQAERGLTVSVLVTALGRRTTERREGGVQVIRAARMLELRSTPLAPALVLRLRSMAPDIVHLHFPYPFGETAQLFARKGRATVVTYHSDVVRQRLLGWLYRPLMRRLLSHADRILATSEAYRRSSKVLTDFASKTTVVPLGIEIDRFASPDPASIEEIRQRFPGPLVLFVGRLRYYKGVETLLSAMERLDTPATLLIAGSGPLSDRCRRWAQESAVAGRVQLLGDVADSMLPAYYAAADVFVLPSCARSEAYGLSLAEAMASATAAISTELGTGTSWVNRHGETGWVVPPRDPAALATALDQLLADPEQRQTMADQARQRAATELSADRMIDRVIQIYESVLAPQE